MECGKKCCMGPTTRAGFDNIANILVFIPTHTRRVVKRVMFFLGGVTLIKAVLHWGVKKGPENFLHRPFSVAVVPYTIAGSANHR